MRASREQAFDLLSKWKSESKSVLVIFSDGDATAFMAGSIASLSKDSVEFEGLPHSGLSMLLSVVEEFDFSDIREQPVEVRMAHGRLVDELLLLKFSSGSQVRIHPLRSEDEPGD
jgi:hypothetical protein